MLAHRIWFSLVATLLTLMLAACGGGETASQRSSVPLDATYAPKGSPAEALEALLAAEKNNDHIASYALLTPDAREEFNRPDVWTERRNELGDITAYNVLKGEGRSGEAIAEVEHQPSLDPFKGLVAAKERQLWTAVQFDAGWLLQPEPVITPEYPSEEKLVSAAEEWVRAVQLCDQQKADTLQAVKEIYAVGGPTLCGAAGPVTTTDVGELADGTVTNLIIDQYSADAARWAKVVDVTSPAAFSLVMAPIGDQWKVLGLITN